MRCRFAPLLLLAVLCSACSRGAEAPEPVDGDAAAKSSSGSDAKVDALRTAAVSLRAKPEKDLERIRVRHILISFAGVRGISGATRTQAEAEALAADLYAQVLLGADFAALMKAYSNDTGPGIYGLGSEDGGRMPRATEFKRSEYPSLADVGWRLEVGEVGINPYDPVKSPFGWHLVQRIE